MLLRLRYSLALVLTLVACSSSDNTSNNGSSGTTPPPPDGVVGDIRESVTWEDGTKIAGVVRIVEGVTVTIAPGAKITCNSEAASILVGGTVKVDSKAKHASIECSKWQGFLIAANGKADIDGLDIQNAQIGYQVTAGAQDSTVKNSKITTCVRPFLVAARAKLILDHVEASVPTTVGQFDKSFSENVGTLEAHYLTYEAQGNEGIMTKEGGNTTITDSTLTAHGGQDLVSSYGGATVNVSYSTMTGAHCGVHLQGLTGSASFDHITSTGNLFGFTIYGSNPETNVTVKNSNLSGSIAWLDMQGDHGAVFLGENNAVVNNTAGKPNAIIGTPIKTDDAKSMPTDGTAEIVDAKPRPE